MKKTWRKLIAAFCAASMLMTLPGVLVYAADTEYEDIIESIEVISDEAEMDDDYLEEGSGYEEPNIAAEAEPSDDINALTDIVEEPAEDAVLAESETPDLEEQEDAAEAVDLPEKYSLPAEDTPIEEILGGGSGTYQVGDGVYALYDADKGAVHFININTGSGVLWSNWLEKSGIDRSSVRSIDVFTELFSNSYPKVKLPEDCLGAGDDQYFLFGGLTDLTDFDLSGFDTSKVTNMDSMFFDCQSLTKLDLSSFNTSKVTNMHGMFGGCNSLKTLNLSSFNTSNVTDMGYMFHNCYNLTSIDLHKFNTSKVTAMHSMFHFCESLESLDLSGFNTSNVTTMGYMFEGCYNLTSLNLKNFNTSKVTYTFDMFKDCENLKYVNLGSFDMSKVTYAVDMFKGCNALGILITPNNRKNTSKCYFPHSMYDKKGKKYDQLPVNTASMVLGRSKAMAVSGFTDVGDSSHAYYKAICWAVEKGITKGYPDGTFGINKTCTRGEMVMFLWRYAGQPAPKPVSKSPFKDVPTTHTFYKAILWAYQKGITKGYSDGTFGINKNVSRGESMMFLWRLKGKPEPMPASVSPFKDVPKNHVFYKAILWGYQKKITTGYTSGVKKGTFGINENCTRGQIVTFLYRARNL